MQGSRSDLNSASVRSAAVSYVIEECLGGLQAAAADLLHSGKLIKPFVADKLRSQRGIPVILDNEAYFLWHDSELAAFGGKNGRNNLITAVLAHVEKTRASMKPTITLVTATTASTSNAERRKRKHNADKYATEQQLSTLQELRARRAQLQAVTSVNRVNRVRINGDTTLLPREGPRSTGAPARHKP